MLGRMRNINSEQEAKFILDRISSAERNLAELCYAFGAYSRKAARLRDKGDEISNVVLTYSDSEVINKSTSEKLAKFANALTTISDYGDKRVQYFDSKIIGELSLYEGICKSAKDEVKQIFIARDKEVMRKRQLDRIRDRNPRSRQQIVQAETELVQATSEVTRTIHNLEEQMTTFERQKLHDIKAILLDFISTEIGYHAKALEQLTAAYQHVYAIDEDADLQDFKKALRLPETMPHSAPARSLFRSSQSLGGSLGSIFSTPKKKTPGIPTNSSSKLSVKSQSKSEDELDKIQEQKKGIYDEIEDSEVTESEEASQNSDEPTENSDKHVSPFIAKRYVK